MQKHLAYKLANAPKKPGCYLWKNDLNEIIYIGKAKNLFNRVHQYFNKTKDNKTTLLVEQIADVDFIIVNNENEALILENNLIKKHKPKYNILLKDGSNYPYIVITNEQHPRIIYTRDLKKYQGQYYGPFAASSTNKYDLYNLLLKIFPLRKCNKIPKQKCLYYDMNQCLGPCINKVENDQYQNILNDINHLFSGKDHLVIDQLKKLEQKQSEALEFEDAQKTLDIINAFAYIKEQQTINIKAKYDVDVIGFSLKDDLVCIVIFSYINGKLLTKNQQISQINNDDLNEVIGNYLMQYYYENLNMPKKCYVNLNDETIKDLSNVLKIQFLNVSKGLFYQMINNAIKTAKTILDANFLVYQNKLKKENEGFEQLKFLLNLKNLQLIHVFDMSNLFDDAKVGAMIALKNGKFDKNLYRKFLIKNLNASADIEYMHEVLSRQYKKMLNDHEPLPNLIIVDGGILQVKETLKVLESLEIKNQIKVIGLAKDDKHKTKSVIFEDLSEFILNKEKTLYFYLNNIQEEVHRYAINFFRKKYKESKFASFLDQIPGVGVKTKNKLLKHFENIANIKKASLVELTQLVGEKIALKIIENKK